VVTHLQPRGKVAAKAVKPVRADRLAAVGDWEEF
jgi:hypothetical protein